ncbi:MAG: class E sortase [Acidimicrobiia bacterium]
MLGGLGEALVTTGVLILAFVAYQLWGTGFYEAQQQRALLERFQVGSSPGANSTDPPADTPVLESTAPRSSGTSGPRSDIGPAEARQPGRTPTTRAVDAIEGIVGVISIPSLGLERAVVDGVTPPDLRQGPGHYPGTSLPGQPGNTAIAGHRTTYGAPFNRLDELAPGDSIAITTRTTRFVYRVTGSKIVAPTDVAVLDATTDNRLTLTTCHPKFSDRQRLVVTAVLTSEPSQPEPDGQATGPAGDSLEGAGDTGRAAGVRHASLGANSSGSPGATTAWGLAAALLGGTWRWVIRRRRHWSRFLVGLPPFLIALVVFYAHLELLLPSNF